MQQAKSQRRMSLPDQSESMNALLEGTNEGVLIPVKHFSKLESVWYDLRLTLDLIKYIF